MAIDKALAHGLSMVGAHNTWYTGMLSYYAEQVVAKGAVAMIASNTSAWVAPHGASEGAWHQPDLLRLSRPRRPGDLGHRHLDHHPRRRDAGAPARARWGRQPTTPPGNHHRPVGRPGVALMAWGGAKGSGPRPGGAAAGRDGRRHHASARDGGLRLPDGGDGSEAAGPGEDFAAGSPNMPTGTAPRVHSIPPCRCACPERSAGPRAPPGRKGASKSGHDPSDPGAARAA